MKTRYGYIVGRDAIHHANFGAEREGHDEMKVRDTSSKAQILGCPTKRRSKWHRSALFNKVDGSKTVPLLSFFDVSARDRFST